jgi:hypothetical protein
MPIRAIPSHESSQDYAENDPGRRAAGMPGLDLGSDELLPPDFTPAAASG